MCSLHTHNSKLKVEQEQNMLHDLISSVRYSCLVSIAHQNSLISSQTTDTESSSMTRETIKLRYIVSVDSIHQMSSMCVVHAEQQLNGTDVSQCGRTERDES